MMITRSEILTEMYRLCFDQQLDPEGWRTNENGKHYHIDSEGRIDAGFGGKFNGLKPSEIGNVKEIESRSQTVEATADGFKRFVSELRDAANNGETEEQLTNKVKAFSKKFSDQLELDIDNAFKRGDVSSIEKIYEEIHDAFTSEFKSFSSNENESEEDKEKGRNFARAYMYISNALGGAKEINFLSKALNNPLERLGENYLNGLYSRVKSEATDEALSLFENYKKRIAIETSSCNQTDTCFKAFGGDAGVYFNKRADNLGDDSFAPFQVFTHESSHQMDFVSEKEGYKNFSETYNNGAFLDAIQKDFKTFYDTGHRRLKNEYNKIIKAYPDDKFEASRQFQVWLGKEGLTTVQGYRVATNVFNNNGVNREIASDYINCRELGKRSTIELGCVSDIFSGASYVPEKVVKGQKVPAHSYIKFNVVHPPEYWKKGKEYLAHEGFANFMSAYMTNKKAREYLNEKMPTASNVFESMLKELNEIYAKKS